MDMFGTICSKYGTPSTPAYISVRSIHRNSFIPSYLHTGKTTGIQKGRSLGISWPTGSLWKHLIILNNLIYPWSWSRRRLLQVGRIHAWKQTDTNHTFGKLMSPWVLRWQEPAFKVMTSRGSTFTSAVERSGGLPTYQAASCRCTTQLGTQIT